jgi:hypothetical protein
MTEAAILRIFRSGRPIRDAFRRYQIWIDDEKAGAISRKSYAFYILTEGVRTLRVSVDFVSSENVTFEVITGHQVSVTCRASAGMFASSFAPGGGASSST